MSFPKILRSVALIYGALLFCWGAHGQVTINEVMAEAKTNALPDDSISDWVELFNSSGQSVSLANYSLTDSSSTPRKWIFPAGANIPANGYLVVALDSSRTASSSVGGILNAGFGIKGTGDQLELYSPSTQRVDSVRFGPQATDYTIGRVPAGLGSFALTSPTPGASNTLQPLGSDGTLKINEWMASPSSGKDWFEIYNPDPLPVRLTGLFFADDKNEPSYIAPLSFIGGGRNGFLRFFADNSTNDNEVKFKLGGSGDLLGLYKPGVIIDRVQFGQQTDDLSQGRLPDGSASLRALGTATPGASNLTLYDGLVVSELLSHTDPPLEDAVEFYNKTVAPVDISGWFLSNTRDNLKKYKLPAGSIVPPRGYFVIYEGSFNGPSADSPFTFNSAHGDQLYLSQATAAGDLTGSIVQEEFEPSENAVSFGRYETSVLNDYKFVALDRRTFGVDNPASVEQFRQGKGAVNSAPKIGPVVINEVMFNPPDLAGGIDNTDDEYIELLNITGSPAPLYDPLNPDNHWRLQSAVSFSFPPVSSIPPYSFALVVSFDPAGNPGLLAAFRTKYSVPGSVQIFGPYNGKLKNSGDAVELYKPDPPQLPPHPDAGFVPYIRVDKVNYLPATPWPSGAAGTGKSLQRKSAIQFGNDPINWEAAAPTAGSINPSEVSDTDGDGMPDLWEFQYRFNPKDPSDALTDADGDGVNNLQEYQAGTDPLTVDVPLQITSVSRQTANEVRINFNSVAGQSYALQARTSLTSDAWQNVTNFVASGTLASFSSSTGESARKFYRIVTPAP